MIHATSQVLFQVFYLNKRALCSLPAILLQQNSIPCFNADTTQLIATGYIERTHNWGYSRSVQYMKQIDENSPLQQISE